MTNCDVSLHSPKHWNPEVISRSNKWRSNIIVEQNERDEDVIEVAAMQWKEDEGQACVTSLLEHL
jgi:hypothetical protein